ncbi:MULTISPECIES: hypothetical protein [Cryobacterium]|uniref:Uncharacterized protein n=1 Tax=Cryobacterium breve TaxID=1259258 RepID=A0ABY2IW61_9MICO|nr:MULTISPECIES: hypothetical protein [Cryobacterium]TFC93140.1 hypothetical protein E3T20_11005 [Cryobacterium sp. TmT3-12]TFC96125.1 hypothetical protein E3O65_13875 [Cryobacterium breve]
MTAYGPKDAVWTKISVEFVRGHAGTRDVGGRISAASLGLGILRGLDGLALLLAPTLDVLILVALSSGGPAQRQATHCARRRTAAG